MKKYPTTISPQVLIEESKKYLQAYQLDEALSTINRSLLQNQLSEGSDLSLNGQILWCKILLTKGRFIGDEAASKLALNKLEACHELFAASGDTSIGTPLPLIVLLTKAYYQLGNVSKAQQLAQQLLLFSKTTNYVIGEIEAYNLLGQITLLKQQPIKALSFGRKAQELLIQDAQILDQEILATNYELLADIFLYQKEYKQAAIYARKLLQLVKENLLFKEAHIKAHIILGICATTHGNHTIALSNLLKAKELASAIGQKQLLIISLLQIAILYNKVRYTQGALKCLKTIDTKYEGILNDKATTLLFQNTWGQALYDAHQLDEAAVHFEMVQQIANQVTDRQAKIIALVHLSAIHTAKKEFKKALVLAKRANEYIEDIMEDVNGQAFNLINLGNLHFQLGKFSEAIKLTSRGIATAKRRKEEHNEIRGYQIMSLIFQKQKNYKNALLYQMIYAKFFEDFFQKNEGQVLSNFEATFTIRALKKMMNDE